jgi:hypothetical protein
MLAKLAEVRLWVATIVAFATFIFGVFNRELVTWIDSNTGPWMGESGSQPIKRGGHAPVSLNFSGNVASGKAASVRLSASPP